MYKIIDAPLCAVTSKNAHEYFARDNDEQGRERHIARLIGLREVGAP